MKHAGRPHFAHFFTTPSHPCPYLPDRMERKLVTELSSPRAQDLYDVLCQGGFRRSHGVAYIPACHACQACRPARVRAPDFRPGRSFRRILKANTDLRVEERPPVATEEQFALFSRYMNSRHGDGDMAAMGPRDYRYLVEETWVDSMVVEFRDRDGILVAACLTDRLNDGLSAVYSFFDPALASRSLGTYVILWSVSRCSELAKPYLYLGFWIAESRKMAYKARFRPLEIFVDGTWRDVEDGDLTENLV